MKYLEKIQIAVTNFHVVGIEMDGVNPKKENVYSQKTGSKMNGTENWGISTKENVVAGIVSDIVIIVVMVVVELTVIGSNICITLKPILKETNYYVPWCGKMKKFVDSLMDVVNGGMVIVKLQLEKKVTIAIWILILRMIGVNNGVRCVII